MPEPSPRTTTRTFLAAPASVPAARRLVREVLRDGAHEHWLDDAQLAVSELATNAVLHAHTDFTVTVTTTAEGVFVQVWDDDPALPARRVSDRSATTGRGLELLAAVATAHGVQTVGPAKVVWFCLGMGRPDDAADVLLDRWQDPLDVVPDAPADRRPVRLLGMPTALWLSAREHHNTLMRELSLDGVRGEGEAAQRLPGDLVAADRARSLVLGALRTTERRSREDLVLQLDDSAAPLFAALRDVLDDGERRASSGQLLAAPGPDAIVAVRRWACAQVLTQLDGGRPTAWAGPLSL